MKIKKILKRLLQLHPKSVDLSLIRIKRLLKDLNNPEKKISNVIQVVGTNGKHSICSTLREIFETAGYTVNLNISPSLRKFNERYYFSGKYISDEDLYDLLIEVERINNDKSISFHEIITAAWILHASRKEAEVNIMEAGALFRLDSSNVFQKNICSVVMPIGIDHLDFLKNGTIDEIVYEKCSHLLSDSKIFVSEQKNSVLEKIKKNIANNSSKKFILGEDYKYKKDNNGFTYEDKLSKLNSITTAEEKRAFIDVLCKYWEAEQDIQDLPYGKEFSRLTKEMKAHKKQFTQLLKQTPISTSPKDTIRKAILDSVCETPGISSREIHDSLPKKLHDRSSPQIIAKLAKDENITNIDGAYYKINDDIKKNIWAYTAAFIDSDGYITMDKNHNPRVGLVATGNRGKAFMLEMHKSLGMGRLHLDQKSPQDTRLINRLNFYSQDDITKLISKTRP